MISIHLHNLLFHAYHGIHEEEKILGTEFEVNADIEIDNNNESITHIDQTVNYVTVYKLIRDRMHLATPLLETIAQELVESIHAMDDRIKFVNITLKKNAPPIENFQGSVGVSYKTSF